MLQTVDGRFHRVVLASTSLKTPPALAGFFGGVAFASLGHDPFRDVELEQLPVFLPRKAFIKTQTANAFRAVAP
jgi:hypothetical protein